MIRSPAELAALTGRKRRGRKYRNEPTYYGEVRYDSRSEARFAASLDIDPAVARWERQVVVPLGPTGESLRVDFVIWTVEGEHYAVDVKGMETPVFKLKRRLWRRYGPMPLHLVRNGKTYEIVEGGGGPEPIHGGRP